MSSPISVLLERVPDRPEHVDLRAVLRADDCEVWPAAPNAQGHAAFAPSLDLAYVWGSPAPHPLESLAARVGRGTQVVCDPNLRERVQSSVDALLSEPAIFFALSEDSTPATPTPGTVHLVERASDVELSALPVGMRAEMEATLERTFVAMRLVDDQPVAFCYPHHETESYWDVSVDTLESHRRCGYATEAFAAACAHLRANGKAPVWGALASNAASVRMAQRLGFHEVAVRHLLIAAGPRKPSEADRNSE